MPNGCGPSWMPRKLAWLFFGWFFEASCDRHDVGYNQGGDEVRRFECDWKFLHAMFRDAARVAWYWRLIAYPVAVLFFLLVRVLGWARFNYTKSGVTY